MPWFKVDDKLHDHRKARAAGPAAMGLWVLAGSWSADNLTDGFIPSALLPRWGRQREANRLVEVGLWHTDEQDGEKGWRFHEWDERQPTRAQKLDEREAKVEAGRKGGLASGRARRQPNFEQNVGSLADLSPEIDESQTQTRQPRAGHRPEASQTSGDSERNPRSEREATTKQSASGLVELPSRPTDADASVSSAVALTETPDRFDEFWNTYSHKVGRKKAETAYRAALKKPGVTADLLVAAAASYIEWQVSEGKHPKFTKHPATWLTGEHWTDERPGRTARPQTRVQEHLTLVQQLAAEEAEQHTIPQIGYRR